MVVTEYGPVPVSWKVEGEKLSFRVETPAGIKTTLKVPQMGDNARWILDGKANAGQKSGRFLTAEVGAGVHQGSVSFTKIAPPAPPVPTSAITGKTSPDLGAFEADVAKDDLVNLGQPTLLAVTDEKVTIDGGARNADAIRNGTTQNGAGGGETQNDGKTFRGYGEGDAVTFNLNTALHPEGYDLSRIVSFAGHTDSRASQNYAILVSLAKAPTKFLPLFASASVASGGGSSELILATPKGGVLEGDNGLKASGVAAVRFEFRGGSAQGGAGLGFNVYREIDIIGKPAAR